MSLNVRLELAHSMVSHRAGGAGKGIDMLLAHGENVRQPPLSSLVGGHDMRACRFLTAAILLFSAAPLWAEEAADAFNKLYGEELNRVAATPSPADDIALAKQLLQDATKIGKQPELLAVLCEKAYELAAKDASGHPTAKAALDLLAEKVPQKKTECLQKGAALYQKQYATAHGDAKTKAGEKVITALSTLAEAEAAELDVDDAAASLRQAIAIATAIKSANKAILQSQLDNLLPQQKIEKQIAALKAKLDADPKDEASRKEIVRLCLVEMDNPAEAAKFVNDSLDEPTRKYVPAAAKPLEEAPEAACKDLGEWYRGLADQASAPAGKGAMLRRAQGYYQRFLDIHKAEDVARGAATLTLKKIEDALAKLDSAAKSKYGAPSLVLDLGNGATMKVVLIRPGKFMMGSPDSEGARDGDEGPQREVTISKPYYIGAAEVTQEQYVAVMGTNPSARKEPTNPVDNVSWNDARDFCRKLSEKTRMRARLPTEAEWEYACRAGSKTRFCFGDAETGLAEYAWYNVNSGARSQPVAQKKPNTWGLYDMYGNMSEPCSDRFGLYTPGPAVDPQGPASGSYHVMRGGAFGGGSWSCRSASRAGSGWFPDYHNGAYGVRVVIVCSAQGR